MTLTRRQFLKTGGIIAGGFAFAPAMIHAMNDQTISDDLKIVPSKTSSKNDFDFYPGDWEIRVERLAKRFQNSKEWLENRATEELRPILNGLGLIGQFRQKTDSGLYEGMAMHLFDPATRLWSNYWADSDRGFLEPPVIGSFDGKGGVFYGKDSHDGKPVDVMYKWDLTDRSNPVWSQAFSRDKGKAWETNLIMHYSKTKR